jgi:hypothetical protein
VASGSSRRVCLTAKLVRDWYDRLDSPAGQFAKALPLMSSLVKFYYTRKRFVITF